VVLQGRIASPWLLFSWIYRLTEAASEELNQKKRLDDFTRKMIKKRREAMKSGEVIGRKSLLDYMLEISDIHPDFTEQDIIDEACTFMLAVSSIMSKLFPHCHFVVINQGQDSVGASLAFSIFLLAQHQQHQEKCFEEISAIFGDDDRPPSMCDLKEMKHLEMCIKEAIR
jgi:cytochrome P450 family 4